MSKEHRLKTATGFCEFWDGQMFKRIRASEDTPHPAGPADFRPPDGPA